MKNSAKVKLTCQECGKAYFKFPSQNPNGRSKYCSRNCNGIANGRRERPRWLMMPRTLNANPRWKDGSCCYRKYALHKEDACSQCGTKEKLIVHHRDHNRSNNDHSNWEVLCSSCHAKHHEFWKSSSATKTGTTTNRKKITVR